MRDHELFPSQDESPAPVVEKILVTRLDGGSMKYAPHSFAPEELPDLEALFSLFGGGRYELIARDAKKITARRAYELAGPSLPFVESAPPAQAAPAPVHAPQGASLGDKLLAVLPTLVPAVIGLIQSGQQQQQAFLMTLMNTQASASKEHVALMQQAHAASQAQMATLMQALVQTAKTAGGGNPAEWMRLGKEMAESGGGDDDEGDDDDPNDIISEVERMTETIDAATNVFKQARDAVAPNGARRQPAQPVHESEEDPSDGSSVSG